MATFTLDGKTVTAPDGMNLIEAAAANGVDIPHYCYHPGLSVAGNCRMCLCEVEGARGPQIACSQAVREGLVVRTDTALVEKMRKGVQEFLLLNHPIDCPICDQAGECRLQDYYMSYGQYDNRSDVTKVQKQKALDIGPLVVLDQERCILCTRCVRFTSEVSQSHELIVSGRGDTSVIETFPGMQLDNPYSGNVVDICPVGALTSKDFRFKMRVWFMKSVKSVCTGCARGCNIFLDEKDAVVYRYRPRTNLAVNRYWICDDGRLSYRRVNENRLTSARLRGASVSFRDVYDHLVGLLRAERPHGSVVLVASPHSSLEDNFLLRCLDQRHGRSMLRAWDASAPATADDLLRCADPTPNRAGLSLLDVETSRASLLAALAGPVQVAVLMQNNLAQDPEVAQRLRQIPVVVYLGSHDDETAALAQVVIPVATHAEKFGSFVNVDGRVQRFYQAFEAPGDAVSESVLLAALLHDLYQESRVDDVEEVWALMRQEVPELATLSWYGLGDEGVLLESARVASSAVPNVASGV